MQNNHFVDVNKMVLKEYRRQIWKNNWLSDCINLYRINLNPQIRTNWSYVDLPFASYFSIKTLLTYKRIGG